MDQILNLTAGPAYDRLINIISHDRRNALQKLTSTSSREVSLAPALKEKDQREWCGECDILLLSFSLLNEQKQKVQEIDLSFLSNSYNNNFYLRYMHL